MFQPIFKNQELKKTKVILCLNTQTIEVGFGFRSCLWQCELPSTDALQPVRCCETKRECRVWGDGKPREGGVPLPSPCTSGRKPRCGVGVTVFFHISKQLTFYMLILRKSDDWWLRYSWGMCVFLKKGPWQNSAVTESGSRIDGFFLSTEVIQKVWEVTCTNGLQG